MTIKLINKKCGSRSKEYLLEQYKIISASADKITDKRQSANKFYLSVNSFILAVAAYFAYLELNLIPLLISCLGILISVIWRENIKSFKKLNSAKFKVIHELEEHLPAKVYQKEDEYCVKEGYYKLTSIEQAVPFIFGILYVAILVFVLLSYFNLS